MHHLTLEQRCQLEELMSRGFSCREIGKRLKIHASTVSRERRRNRIGDRYNFIVAQGVSEIRRHDASSRFRKIKNELEEKILDGLYSLWSPDQISGRLKLEGISISPESIYRYARKKGLRKILRHQGKKYKPKNSEAGVNCIPERTDISARPKIVDEKTRIGDWEGDTVISHKSHCALMTLVDRGSKYVIIRKIGRKTADNLNSAALKTLKKLRLPVRSITFDNGKEFSKHKQLAKKLKTKIYFARPYKSCDRGLNEHTNGLIRQFLPKKFDFKDVSEKNIRIIENFLNTRPRKVLNYRAPIEVIFHRLDTSTVAFHC